MEVAGDEPDGELISQQTDTSLLTDVDETETDAGQETGWSGRREALATGLLAAFFVALLGNVDGGGQVVRKLAELSTSGFDSMLPGVQTGVRALGGLVQVLGPAKLSTYNYWDPSRVIPFTINEFPYWSFLFADLHPHMIGIPFTVLFLALAFALLMRPTRADGEGRWLRVATGGALFIFLTLTLGALAVINTWDLPTYFGLAVLVWLVREWRTGRLTENRGRALLRTGVFAVGLVAGALLLYWPFFANYKALASSGIGLSDVKTELGKWLNVWGFLGFLAVSFLLVELRRRASRPSGSSKPPGGSAADIARDPALLRWLRLAMDRFGDLAQVVALTPGLSGRVGAAIGVSVLATAALWLTGWQVPAALLLPMLATFALLWRRTGGSERAFLVVLVFTALLVLIGVEFVYLKDHLQGGEWRRMNTLFKFYIQVWVMLALATAVALPGVWRFIHSRWRRGWRVLWTVAFGWLLLLSLAFLVFGTTARLDDRFPQRKRPPAGRYAGWNGLHAGRHLHVAPRPGPIRHQSDRAQLRLRRHSLAAGQRQRDAAGGRGAHRLLPRGRTAGCLVHRLPDLHRLSSGGRTALRRADRPAPQPGRGVLAHARSGPRSPVDRRVGRRFHLRRPTGAHHHTGRRAGEVRRPERPGRDRDGLRKRAGHHLQGDEMSLKAVRGQLLRDLAGSEGSNH